MNFAREIVTEKDGLVEILLMYEQLHSHGVSHTDIAMASSLNF
jgi:hypothetical protein